MWHTYCLMWRKRGGDYHWKGARAIVTFLLRPFRALDALTRTKDITEGWVHGRKVTPEANTGLNLGMSLQVGVPVAIRTIHAAIHEVPGVGAHAKGAHDPTRRADIVCAWCREASAMTCHRLVRELPQVCLFGIMASLEFCSLLEGQGDGGDREED